MLVKLWDVGWLVSMGCWMACEYGMFLAMLRMTANASETEGVSKSLF